MLRQAVFSDDQTRQKAHSREQKSCKELFYIILVSDDARGRVLVRLGRKMQTDVVNGTSYSMEFILQEIMISDSYEVSFGGWRTDERLHCLGFTLENTWAI